MTRLQFPRDADLTLAECELHTGLTVAEVVALIESGAVLYRVRGKTRLVPSWSMRGYLTRRGLMVSGRMKGRTVTTV